MKRSLTILCVMLAVLVVVAAPATAKEKLTGSLIVTEVDCGNGHVLDIESDSYWYQVNKSEETGNNGLRVVTFHQTHTYTSRLTGESFRLINTGVVRLRFDDSGNQVSGRGSGHTHLGDDGDLIYGQQDYITGETAGHEFSVCDMFG